MSAEQGRVVVGVDGSEHALRAVRWAAAEAALRRLPLRLVNAFGWEADRVVGQPALGDRYREVLLERAREGLAGAAALARREAPGVEVDTEVVVGFPIGVLGAEARAARLVVVGDRGLNRLEGLLAGSVAVALAAHGACPVVIVRGADRGATAAQAPVVVGVDGSPVSEAAIAFAHEEAVLRGAPLVAVHAWSDVVLDPALAPLLDLDAVETDERQLLAERLAGWSDKHPDVPVEQVVVREHPARALLDQAVRAQLLVVGSRGRGELAGLALGSVSNAVVHRAACPVAVVRPEPDRR